MCRKLVLNAFAKYFARLSCDVRASVANLSPRNFGEFTMRTFRDTRTNVVRMSHESRASVAQRSRDSLEKTCEHLWTIWRENKTKQHSYKCRATLLRMSQDCRVTLVRFFFFKIRPKLANLSHKCPFSETAM